MCLKLPSQAKVRSAIQRLGKVEDGTLFVFTPGGSSSFGGSRAPVMASAILRHMTDQTPLDDAIKEALGSHNLSLENPAFVERSGLQEILNKLQGYAQQKLRSVGTGGG